MGPNIEPLAAPFQKMYLKSTLNVIYFYSLFSILKYEHIKATASSDLLIDHYHEILQQLNHEECK